MLCPILILLFLAYGCTSAQSEFLETSFRFQWRGNITTSSLAKYQMVEIYTIDMPVYISVNKIVFSNVTQLSFILLSEKSPYELIVRYPTGSATFWTRFIGLNGLLPGICSGSLGFVMPVIINTEVDSSFVKIKFASTAATNFNELKCNGNQLTYELWNFPFFPNGSFSSWSSEFPVLSSYILKRGIISAINSSLSNTNLRNRGFRLHSISNNSFYIAKRQTYISLYIIKAISASGEIQYPPILVYHCLYGHFTNNKCNIFGKWKDTAYFAIAVSFLFVIWFHRYPSIHIIGSCWILTVIFVSIGLTFLNNELYMKILIWGVAPFIGLVLSIAFCYYSKKGRRIGILPTAFVLIYIILSVMWSFIMSRFALETYVIISSSIAVAVIFSCLFIYFHNITISYGGAFLGMTIIATAFSVVFSESSVFPYLASDFYFYILYKSKTNGQPLLYSTLPVINDLITFVFCGFVMILLGSITYYLNKRNKGATNKTDSFPMAPSTTVTRDTSAVNQNIFIIAAHTEQTVTAQLHNYSSPVSSQIPDYPSSLPPKYEDLYKTATAPNELP